MRWLTRRWLAACVGTVCLTPAIAAQTLPGSSLTHNSSGSGTDNWTLSENGYVGTYLTLDAPGQVTLKVNAAGTSDDAVAPHMNIVVADTQAGFDVAAGFSDYQHTFDLPAGTYFVRTEFNNDVPAANRQLTIASLDVSGPATVSNTTDTSANNANALASADTYIENFRKGPARLTLVGAAPESQVRVKLKQHDFNFGTAVGGTTTNSVNSFLNNAAYSNFLLSHFNTVTQGNAGKWAYNEASRDVVTMSAVDRILQYAEDHGLRVRLHNMLWGDSQQPGWVNTLLNSANSGSATAKSDLRSEISERIDYYVGDNNPATTNDRAKRYLEMDLLNEHVHQPKYWNVYGPAGIADMFSEAASAIDDAGSDARLYLNEYNVLQFGADDYGNWYRQDVEEIVNLGGAIGGIGVQYYPFNVAGSNAHSADRIQQIFQNLSVTGLPISLTEFGVQTNGGTTVAQAAAYLEDTMRMVFGTPNATTFMMWGFAPNDIWSQAPMAALVDANWNLTQPGQIYEQLMAQWDTDLLLPIQPDGTIDFSGFYGIYEITVDGKTFDFDLTKGAPHYSLIVAQGDYNGDGTVDAADYIVWRDTLGSSTDLRADGDGNHFVDEGDYDLWKQSFGTSYGTGSGAYALPVPEPAATSLLAIGGSLLTAQALRNRTSRNRRGTSISGRCRWHTCQSRRP